jgi:2-polyprenyl-3-methyl-5-hydroxy-6-metoxy-1,4-benzoquinol methylase
MRIQEATAASPEPLSVYAEAVSAPGTHDRDYITEVNAAYHDAIVGKYDQRFEGSSPEVVDWVSGLFRREVLPVLDVVQGRPKVIDFGCGSGNLEGYLCDRDLDLLGLDVSEGMLAKARERFPQWRFEKADLYSFETDERYHLVMENAVLHHLVDYEALIDKMAALTRPGGVLYMGNEPNRLAYRYLSPLAKLWRATINRYRTADAESLLGAPEYEALSEYHLFYGQGIDAAALARRLEDHGFRRVEVHYSLRELFSAIEEAYPRARLNAWTPDVVRDRFRLSRNFTLIAQR